MLNLSCLDLSRTLCDCVGIGFGTIKHFRLLTFKEAL